MNPITFSQVFAASVVNGICLSQSAAGAGNLTLNGSLVTAGVAYLDANNKTPNIGSPAAARRVLWTSSGNDTGITMTITGTDRFGNTLAETITGSSGATSQTKQDFATVKQAAVSGATAGNVQVGTSGVGSSTWWVMDIARHPFGVKLNFAVVSGSVNCTVEHTPDDPNWQDTAWNTTIEAGSARPPTVFPHPTMAALVANAEGNYTDPVFAIRLTTNSGAGTAKLWITQAGLHN